MGVARLASVTPPKLIGETSLTKIKQSHFYYYDIMCNHLHQIKPKDPVIVNFLQKFSLFLGQNAFSLYTLIEIHRKTYSRQPTWLSVLNQKFQWHAMRR